jgi:hypothetical protein
MSNTSFNFKGNYGNNNSGAIASHKVLIFFDLSILVLVILIPKLVIGQIRFSDDFENGLTAWEIYGVNGALVLQSGDPNYGSVLELRPNGDVHVIIRGSENWQGIRLEGEALFPTVQHSYLGFIYNFNRQGGRMDFGNVYIKGNGSYLQVNPHRDYNVSRTLYPEMSAMLTGPDSIRIGEWLRFKVEVIGSECHVYVRDMSTPKIMFADLELSSGALGFQPRSVGASVWVDNVQVFKIDRFGYSGTKVPEFEYKPDQVLTDWEVLGPLTKSEDDAARGIGSHSWRPFATDSRGAVVTGRIVDTHGPRSVAYFRTTIASEHQRTMTLHFSTIDDLAIWINGRFHWFLNRARRAWPDFWYNQAHSGQKIPIDLQKGENIIVIRTRGGVYATGGFFVRIEEPQVNK